MSFVPVSNFDLDSFKSSTLILPTVSIGNVPQLVVDLLIQTFKLERVGFLEDDYVMPIAGIREDVDQPGVTVPIEVFQSKDKLWTSIQQRSPTVKGKRDEFIKQIKEFATKFARVVILTSMDASRRLDSQLQGEPFRVYGEGSLIMRAVSLSVPVLENFELEYSQDSTEDRRKIHLPGSGLARHLYEALSEQVETTLLIMFALEGDNAQDGVEFARFVNTLLKIQTTGLSSWTIPKSWEYLFGTPYNAELYQ
ncbi:MAG: PAC2 family-domain-containing protein [Benjaminiella poitrasii]|nr:MAG: PAC2 family-domain-containing protein [Benjaminiella poitrasii]